MFWIFRKQEKVVSKETREAYERLQKAIGKSKGLHFELRVDREGWMAECKEFPGIITGGANPNPSQKEIFNSIIDSIKTAFDVPTDVQFKELEKSFTIKQNLVFLSTAAH